MEGEEVKRLKIGERIVGMGLLTQKAIRDNRQKKVYGRVFGNK